LIFIYARLFLESMDIVLTFFVITAQYVLFHIMN